LLGLYDVFDGPKNFWAAMSPANALAAIVSIMMTAVVIISLIYRASPKTPYRFSWDGAALVGMYLGALGLLYLMG
jgi:TRAP-type C4-dicarboxylate transport system permease small subunit